MKNKREQIEKVVNSHPTLKRVASYLSIKYNINEKEVYDKFISFLENECSVVVDNTLMGIKCFTFDESTMNFTNRTIYSNSRMLGSDYISYKYH